MSLLAKKVAIDVKRKRKREGEEIAPMCPKDSEPEQRKTSPLPKNRAREPEENGEPRARIPGCEFLWPVMKPPCRVETRRAR